MRYSESYGDFNRQKFNSVDRLRKWVLNLIYCSAKI